MPSTVTPNRPGLERLYSVNEDGSRNTLHPADVHGRYQRRKHVLWAMLIAIYVLLPWIEIGGHPAILIDIPRRHFYLFGATFNAQDFWLAFFFITGLAFTLFVVSALWGRLWCGYACPQTVFLEGVFRRVERWIDGTPRARRELEKAPWGLRKVVKRGLKLGIYLAVALVLAHTFLGYFMPARELLHAITAPPTEHPTAFLFVIAFTAIMFVNFTWFREQLCIVVCPYGRLQGVLYDQHTVNVGYDQLRGEPRGKLGSGTSGDCIDCFRCVDVCPTGIDIRDGTQLECVGCANCIDACDAVMAKIGKPPGLVRYDSLMGFEGQTRTFWRPRLALYGVLLLIGVTVFAAAAWQREPFEIDVARGQGTAYTVDDGTVTNTLIVHLVNKRPDESEFELSVDAAEPVHVVLPVHELELASLADHRLPVILTFPRSMPETLRHIRLIVHSEGAERTIEMPLLGPPVE